LHFLKITVVLDRDLMLISHVSVNVCKTERLYARFNSSLIPQKVRSSWLNSVLTASEPLVHTKS